MSTLKRKNDAFYLDTPSSKRSAGGHRTPLGTFANGQMRYPPTPSSISKVKEEHISSMEKQPGHTNEQEVEEEAEEPESQLPACEREQIHQDLRQKYDELMLAYTKNSFKTKTLEAKLKVMDAQLVSSQEQLKLVGESRQELIKDFHTKHQKSNRTEQRLRAERDQVKKDLAMVRVEKDTAVSERDAAQKTTSQVKEELQEYEQLFALQSKLLARASRAPTP
ncbi:hypothetical protein F5878DRAFT_659986 [Lentinula raphanica]|uniref:Uncharacterized protein n=1 Tax=Lentinula raphanica TaxID=153919 RepID=A0AA38PBS2_9AGAR|nr:hypothetical protein F5878DRAFT_659986 [Lentinula raphanica]